MRLVSIFQNFHKWAGRWRDSQQQRQYVDGEGGGVKDGSAEAGARVHINNWCDESLRTSTKTPRKARVGTSRSKALWSSAISLTTLFLKGLLFLFVSKLSVELGAGSHEDSKVGIVVITMYDALQIARKWLNGFIAFHELGRKHKEMSDIFRYVAVILFADLCGISMDKALSTLVLFDCTASPPTAWSLLAIILSPFLRLTAVTCVKTSVRRKEMLHLGWMYSRRPRTACLGTFYGHLFTPSLPLKTNFMELDRSKSKLKCSVHVWQTRRDTLLILYPMRCSVSHWASDNVGSHWPATSKTFLDVLSEEIF